MDAVRTAQYKARLLQEEQELDEQMQGFARLQEESVKDSVHELSSYDNHPADQGNETFEREKDVALRDNVRALRHDVRHALQRIEAGTFGSCLTCGREIEPDRLEAMPSTSYCLDCRRNLEVMDPPRWRPIEEEVLYPPFGHSFKDGTDMVGYDGEDTWQDVARYGTSDTPSDVGGTDSYEDVFVDHDERHGLVEEVDGIIDVGPDAIPPDPHEADDNSR